MNVNDLLTTGRLAGRNHERFDHLDALRGIAAITVVACHYVAAFGLPDWEWVMTYTPLHVWWDGPAAVSFFFVLSGLVLSLRHFRTTSAPTLVAFNFTGYILARVCRIWLPYLFIMLLSVPLLKFSAQHLHTNPASSSWFAGFWKADLTAESLIRQALDIRVGSSDSGVRNLVPQAWSLSVEIVMSLLLPLGILAAGRSTAWFLGCVLIATIFAGTNPFAFHFAIGIAVAKHFREIVGWLEPRSGIRALTAFVGLIPYTYDNFALRNKVTYAMNAGLYSQAMGSALFIATASSSPAVRGWLSRGFVHHIGRISFSMYLIHMVLLICLTPRVLAVMGGSPPWLSWVVGLAFTVTSSIAISGPLYQYVEVPTMGLGKWLIGKTGPETGTTEKRRVADGAEANGA